MNLQTLRNKLNAIDDKIISLLARRQALAPAIGHYKKKNKLSFYQPEREREILSKVVAQAVKKKINPAMVRNLFRTIFQDSRRIQKAS